MKTLSTVVIIRHGARLDSFDPHWTVTSPTPYDPPLADPLGLDEASICGETLASRLSLNENSRVYIHCSPFMRCAQTAGIVAQRLASASSPSISIRLDAIFGEWMNEDYFTNINPPPSDGHSSISRNSIMWLATNRGSSYSVDSLWSLNKLGTSGQYGESWSSMHKRFIKGMENLLEHYDETGEGYQNGTPPVVVIVTHGAGCNSLLGYLSNQPLLTKVGLAQFLIAQRQAGSGWVLSSSSGAGTLSTSTSSTSLESSLNITPISSTGSWFQHGQYHKMDETITDMQSYEDQGQDDNLHVLTFEKQKVEKTGNAKKRELDTHEKGKGTTGRYSGDYESDLAEFRTPTTHRPNSESALSIGSVCTMIPSILEFKEGSKDSDGVFEEGDIQVQRAEVPSSNDESFSRPITLSFGQSQYDSDSKVPAVNTLSFERDKTTMWSFAGVKADDEDQVTTNPDSSTTTSGTVTPCRPSSEVLPYLVG
jgi:broad specificity phosphatase PhoE